jgi:hypothetical protein
MTVKKALLVTCVLVCGACYYSLFFTSVPFQFLVGLINTHEDVSIIGVEGSLDSGISIRSISINGDDGGKFELENLIVDYETSELTDSNGTRLIVKNINLDKLDIVAAFTDSSRDDGSAENETESESSDESLELFVNNISIKNVSIRNTKDSEAFTLKNFSLKDLVINDETFTFQALDITSSLLELTAEAKQPGQTGFAMNFSGKLFQRADHLLKRDLDFNGSAYGDSNDFKIEVSALDGRSKMSFAPQVGALYRFDDLSLDRLIKRDWPISWIHGSFKQFEDDSTKLWVLSAVGKPRFRIGQEEFSIQTIETSQSGNATTILAVAKGLRGDVHVEWRTQINEEGVFTIHFPTVAGFDQKKRLSLALFNKPPNDLTQEERQKLSNTSMYLANFESEVPALKKTDLKKPAARVMIRPVQRAASQSPPDTGWIRQASYAGNCKKRPAGSTCLVFSDGYKWLIWHGVLPGGPDGSLHEGKKTSVVLSGPNALHHVLGTDLVRTVRRR